ncbi:MAG: STAS domain-containing protein [Rhizonema sp. NSF051]|nr:STAS domain-containing protein [Rhizonema sp. NSF051]
MPWIDAIIMPFTVAIALWTNDLADGVLVGVILSTLIFSWKIAQIKVVKSFEPDGTKQYTVSGQIFFGSIANFIELFNYIEDPATVVINLHQAHVWDHAAVTAISKVISRYQKLNKNVVVLGLNQESESLMRNFS